MSIYGSIFNAGSNDSIVYIQRFCDIINSESNGYLYNTTEIRPDQLKILNNTLIFRSIQSDLICLDDGADEVLRTAKVNRLVVESGTAVLVYHEDYSTLFREISCEDGDIGLMYGSILHDMTIRTRKFCDLKFCKINSGRLTVNFSARKHILLSNTLTGNVRGNAKMIMLDVDLKTIKDTINWYKSDQRDWEEIWKILNMQPPGTDNSIIIVTDMDYLFVLKANQQTASLPFLNIRNIEYEPMGNGWDCAMIHNVNILKTIEKFYGKLI